eukprot:6966867-Alexandrium_andersonii.AAC.1
MPSAQPFERSTSNEWKQPASSTRATSGFEGNALTMDRSLRARSKTTAYSKGNILRRQSTSSLKRADRRARSRTPNEWEQHRGGKSALFRIGCVRTYGCPI